MEPLIPEPPRRRTRSRPSLAARKGNPQRHPVDLTYWLPGTTCPIAILPTRAAVGVFSGGSRRACSRASSKSWPRTSGRAWGVGSLGVLHRRHLRGGQKGGPSVGRPSGAKGYEAHGGCRRLWSSSLSMHAASASPHEVTLVEETIVGACFAPGKPERLISDRAYDSDPLDAELRQSGIERIAPRTARARRSRRPRAEVS